MICSSEISQFKEAKMYGEAGLNMEAVRLEKVRENTTATDRETVKKLMTCPYLEEELGGVYERGVRLPVERRAGKSKVPKAILMANAALDKELHRQMSLLDSAKRHRVSIISWAQRQFFIRKMFDSHNNLRYTTRKGSVVDFASIPHMDRGCVSPDNFSEIFECFVTSMAKAAKSYEQKNKQRAQSVTICDTSIPLAQRRSVYSAPAARSNSNNVRMSGITPNCDTVPSSATRRTRSASVREPLSEPAAQWYSCLTAKPWMLPDQRKLIGQRSGPIHRVASSRLTSTQLNASDHRSSTPYPSASMRHYSSNTLEVDGYASFVMNKLPKVPCLSMKKWKSQRNRALIRRILPTLSDSALQKMLDLLGEGIDERKQQIYKISKDLANQNTLADKRWRDLEKLLDSLQNV